MPLVTKAADERLNQLNFQMASLRFGMATEIAAHAPFGKSSSALKNRDRPYNTTWKFETFYGTPCKKERLEF